MNHVAQVLRQDAEESIVRGIAASTAAEASVAAMKAEVENYKELLRVANEENAKLLTEVEKSKAATLEAVEKERKSMRAAVAAAEKVAQGERVETKTGNEQKVRHTRAFIAHMPHAWLPWHACLAVCSLARAQRANAFLCIG